VRIALLIERMDPSRGGRERSTQQIAAALARRGHEVVVLCQEGASDSPGVEVCPLGARGRLRWSRLAHYVADARRAFREADYDVVHAVLPVPGADVYQPRGGTVPAQRRANQRRRPAWLRACFDLAEPANRCRRRLARLERRVMADASVVCLAVSEMVAEEFRRHYGRTRGVRVIYNGVDVPDPDGPRRERWRRERRASIGAADDAAVFLTVATNPRLKGVGEAVEALFGAGRTGARLVVVGDERGEARRRAEALGAGDRVHVFGRTDEVFPWYAAADAVVLLSWYDPCSRVVLEAVRWRLPAITTRFNGAAEVLAGGAGIVVDSPRETAAVRAAMDELADPARRAARADACRDVADGLSVDRHVDELLEVYQAVAHGTRREGPRP